MARRLRFTPGGLAYHVMNRSAARLPIFDDAPDYQAFEKVLAQARQREGMRVCAYVLMPNHFHLVLWPRRDGQLSTFMRWLTMTHTQRWHAHRHTAGGGHLYQSRFKSFPIELDDHFLRVCRYVERNPLRANLVPRSADWPWGSLACRTSRPDDAAADLLDDWPVDRPANWTRTSTAPNPSPNSTPSASAPPAGAPTAPTAGPSAPPPASASNPPSTPAAGRGITSHPSRSDERCFRLRLIGGRMRSWCFGPSNPAGRDDQRARVF